jgi:hypothetical protein
MGASVKMKNNIKIRIAESVHDKRIADKIVMDYHSYVSSPRVVGRCIKYIISYNDEDVATFWLGSGFKPTPKSILNYFNLSQKQFDSVFNSVADNKRFCIAHSPHKNFGSQILKLIRQRAKQDWWNKYGNELNAIITTIGDGKKGSVYLADNWLKIGETAGLPKDKKSLSLKWDSKETIADRYIKPTGEDKKIILITDRLGKIIPNSNYSNFFQ